MANQAPDRRKVLEMLGTVAAVSQFPGFSRWMYAAEHSGDHPVQPRAAAYEPQFFTTAEYWTIDLLTELIIPKDESPGARDAGVSEFIDFMVAHDPDIQFPFRTGLAWLDANATQRYGQDFSKLPANHQEDLLRRLAHRGRQLPTEVFYFDSDLYGDGLLHKQSWIRAAQLSRTEILFGISRMPS
jgi:gluconate 2-dehydrogenase gamma chain